jgi:hypothetical protein
LTRPKPLSRWLTELLWLPVFKNIPAGGKPHGF